MEITEIIDAVYKNMLEINKVAPYILAAFLLIAFAVRSIYAYKYSLDFQDIYGVPYYRFDKGFNNNIVQILCYLALLLLFIVSQYVFAVNTFKIDEKMCAICCAIFVLGYNLIVLTPFVKIITMKRVWAISTIITILVIIAVVIYSVYYPFTKGNYNMVENCLMLYSAVILVVYFIYLFVSFSYYQHKSFEENPIHQSGDYEIVTINDNKYIVVLNTKDEILLVKLKSEKESLHIVKSDYLIVESITNRNIEYARVEF